jgi:sortase (surface protein transpeptidase)
MGALLLILAAGLLTTGCGTNSAATGVAASASLFPEEEESVAAVEPLSADLATAPISLAVPELELEVPVMPMGWRVVNADGQRTTEWDVPDAAAGWHINSAKTGTAGNVVLSGKQMGGRAVFAALALGEMEAGQELLLADEEGNVFVYRIRTVSEPIPIAGATAAEQEEAAAYLAPTEEPVLTLVSGWPEFTTTHRVFAVADLVGMME